QPDLRSFRSQPHAFRSNRAQQWRIHPLRVSHHPRSQDNRRDEDAVPFKVHIEGNIADGSGSGPSVQTRTDDNQYVEVSVRSGIAAGLRPEQAELDDVVAERRTDASDEIR